MEHYGGLKVACERVVQDAFGDRAIVVRPGLIVGPYDPTNRFTYWVRRMHDAADGEPVLAPATPDRQVQLIDARDLAAWLLDLLEAGTAGVFNADGPAQPLTMGEALAACAAAAGTRPDVVWADERFLLDRKVEPWMGLPLWIPEDDPEGLAVFDNRRAIAAGLSFRPTERDGRRHARLGAGADRRARSASTRPASRESRNASCSPRGGRRTRGTRHDGRHGGPRAARVADGARAAAVHGRASAVGGAVRAGEGARCSAACRCRG